jgi:hypothetical protein
MIFIDDSYTIPIKMTTLVQSVKAVLKEDLCDTAFYDIPWNDSLFPYAFGTYEKRFIKVRCYGMKKNLYSLWWKLDCIYDGGICWGSLCDSK